MFDNSKHSPWRVSLTSSSHAVSTILIFVRENNRGRRRDYLQRVWKRVCERVRQPRNGINFDTRPFRRSASSVTSPKRDTVNLRRIRSRPQRVGISFGHGKSLNWMNHEIASWKKLSPNKRTNSYPCGSALGTKSATFFFLRFEIAAAVLGITVSGCGSNVTFFE